MPHISPRLLLELSLQPEEIWVQVAYAGLHPDRATWDEESVGNFEALDTKARRRAVKGGSYSPPTPSPETSRDRRKSRSRDKRLMDRRISPGLRYVRRHALDPFLDARLSNGARTTLVYLIARCGKSKLFKACTNWVAQDLAVTTRTIQNHYRALERAGYIHHLGVDRYRRTTIALSGSVEPPPYKPKKLEPKAAPVAPARPPAVQNAVSKEPPSMSASSRAQMEKKISPTQAMKARISDGYAQAVSASAQRNLDPGETASERPRPAQPPSPPLGERYPAQTLKFPRRPRLTQGSNKAADRRQAEPSAFDAQMARILSTVLVHVREPIAEAPPYAKHEKEEVRWPPDL